MDNLKIRKGPNNTEEQVKLLMMGRNAYNTDDLV